MSIFLLAFVGIFALLVHELGYVWKVRQKGVEIKEFEIGLKISEKLSWSFTPRKHSDFKISLNPLLIAFFTNVLPEDISKLERKDKISILNAGVKTSILYGFFALWFSGLIFIVFFAESSESLQHFLTMTSGFIAIWAITTSEDANISFLLNIVACSLVFFGIGTVYFSGFYKITEFIIFGSSKIENILFFEIMQFFSITSIFLAGLYSLQNIGLSIAWVVKIFKINNT
ncbi:MAG: hypothetical protein L3J07_01360 [Candidatus Magasanikbacteria bacterium]|nr:hypothetical protein [Candidatus Magasanikbacteria bacterium]